MTDTSATATTGKSDKSDNLLLSDSPKSAWDIVKEVDWGDQLDSVKPENSPGATVPPAQTDDSGSASSQQSAASQTSAGDSSASAGTSEAATSS